MTTNPDFHYGLRWAQTRVRQFHESAGHPAVGHPTMLQPDRVALRATWMREELDEFIQAATITDQADAIIDLVYFALGTLVEAGVDAETVFSIVHAANMQKILSSPQKVLASDGKIEKPAGWVSPEDLITHSIIYQATGLEFKSGSTSQTALIALAETLSVAAGSSINSEGLDSLRKDARSSSSDWASPNDVLRQLGYDASLRKFPDGLLREDSFHIVIDEALRIYPCIGITFDPSLAYAMSDPPYLESGSIVFREGSHCGVVDHGPLRPGLYELNIDRLLQAIRSADGALWAPDLESTFAS